MVDLSKYKPQHVLISDINTRNKSFQFRDDLKEAQMAKSLKEDGQNFPIVLWKKADGLLNIVCGFRRLAGAKKLKWEKILAYVIPESALPEQEALKLNFVENMERKTLKTLDIVFACDRLAKKGFSQRDIANMINKGKTTVVRFLKVAKAPVEIMEKIKSGELSIRIAGDMLDENGQVVPVGPLSTTPAEAPKLTVNSTKSKYSLAIDLSPDWQNLRSAALFLEKELSKLKTLEQEALQKAKDAVRVRVFDMTFKSKMVLGETQEMEFIAHYEDMAKAPGELLDVSWEITGGQTVAQLVEVNGMFAKLKAVARGMSILTIICPYTNLKGEKTTNKLDINIWIN